MQTNKKRFNTFRQGRINTRKEVRRQQLLRNNLEKRLFKRLNTLFRKFVNVQLHLYKQYGIYEPEIALGTLNDDLFPLVLNHYKRIFRIIIKNNEDKYFSERKSEEAFVFGRSIDFENLVEQYFNTRTLLLTGISTRLARKISSLIETGRANNLTLNEIARSVSDSFLPISRSRAALISRTETHNASSYANNLYHEQVQQDLGVKMLKKWVATGDARTRTAHSLASGQIVDMNEDFIVDGRPMGYAGDPKGGAKNTINCRCIIIYADEEDMN